ncbi:hypothetical protein HZA57_00615 [Candidatus Poribacteria bacterium]|nr:hypothetical protein [Candidatus Poribacteria bacterium]
MLGVIPAAAIVLLNAVVITYVMRERDRTRSGFFLIVSAMSLILWSGGIELWRSLDFEPWALALPTLASTLIPANLLYLAGTRPAPISSSWHRPWMLALVFGPAIAAAVLVDYGSANELRRPGLYFYSSWKDLLAAEGRWPLAYSVIACGTALLLLGVRYQNAASGPERNLPKHLIATIVGPVLFAFLFSITTSTSQVTLVPSANTLAAFVAQMGIFMVIRQEEVERPLYLARGLYYLIMLLVGFLASHLVYTFYEAARGEVLLAPTVRRTILAVTVLVLLAASLPPLQSFFDRVMFRRAWEYRQLVREAHAELRDTRERLRRVERLSVVGEMAARIAHEIKNPLGPIKGYTQMMREKLEHMDDFPQRESFLRNLGIISEEVENIDRRVRTLLDMARKPDLTVQPEDVNKIVERAAILLRLEIEAARDPGEEGITNIRVKEDLDPELPAVPLDRPRIEEAISNLCRNAFEAVGPQGHIMLTTRAADGAERNPGVLISIEDDGPGFTPKARENLFAPFFTEKPGGTGLGLSIVKSHIELHKGHVSFLDRPEGGTIAAIWLPLG